MTDGLYEAYESWTRRPNKVNEDIAHLVAQEIRDASSFDLVAHNVVEKVKHVFQKSCRNESRVGRLDDVTLIVRNLGFPVSTHSQPYSSGLVQPTMSYVEPLQQTKSIADPFPSSTQPHMSSPSGSAFSTGPARVVYGGGQFIPEPDNSQTNAQPTGSYPSQTNAPVYQSHHSHYPSGPSNNSQFSSSYSTPLQAPVQAPVVLPPDRQQSYPVTSQAYGTPNFDHYDPQKTWTAPQLLTNADIMPPTAFSNSPRVPSYENVSPKPMRKSDSDLADELHALNLKDNPVQMRASFPGLSESGGTPTNPSALHDTTKSSPSTTHQRPSASDVTKPESSQHDPSHNTDAENMELYGWTGNEDEPQTLANEQPDTLVNNTSYSNEEGHDYDTLKQDDTYSAPPEKTLGDNSPPKKNKEDDDEEEGTMIVDINGDIGDVSEGSENEEEDTDGSVKPYVKFPQHFPQDLPWDDVEVQ